MRGSRNEETGFGKDLGLMHGVICAGREIGADHSFWSYLAYDRKVFAEVVKTVREARANWLTLSPEEIESIQKWIEKLEASDCPYPEDETYYTRSSHSEYDNRFHCLHHGGSMSYESKGFPELFRKASQSKKIARVAMMIERAFVISYLLSGFYSAEQDPDGTKKDWMHGPLSIDAYFDDIWDCDPRVPTGHFFGVKELKAIPDIINVHTVCYEAKSEEERKLKIPEIVARLRTIKAQVIDLLKQEITTSAKS